MNRPSHKKKKQKSAKKSQDEVKVCGVHACHALEKNRKQDIVRVYVTKERVKDFSGLLKWCAEHRKAYHIVTPRELEVIAASVHHEGVCILAMQRQQSQLLQLLTELRDQRGARCILYLDGVENPHNLGAILRSCAHFGVTDVLADAKRLPRLSPSAYRTAKGGAESVRITAVEDAVGAVESLRSFGFTVCATSDKAKSSLFKFKMPDRCVIILGAETTGVGKELLAAADETLVIPGTQDVESLNVSCAAAVLMAEYCRQHS